MYTFGMCIIDALNGRLGWELLNDGQIDTRLKATRLLPVCPKGASGAEWDLIKKMRTSDPTKRVTIQYVVNRLQEIVREREQCGRQLKGAQTPDEVRMCSSLVNYLLLILYHVIRADISASTSLASSSAPRSRTSFREFRPDARSCHMIREWGTKWFQLRSLSSKSFSTDRKRQQISRFEDTALALSKFQRYLRTGLSEKSVYQLSRSR